MSGDLTNQLISQIRPVVDNKLEELRAAWEAAIHHEMTDAIMAGKQQVAYELPNVKVNIVRKSDMQASLEIESAGLSVDSIKDDLSFYILGPAKTYVFGG